MWDAELDVVIAGAGGCGLIAALRAGMEGLEVGIFEKTEFVLGNTAASAGMIPAAGTNLQKELGIEDSVQLMVEDILRKNKYESDPELTEAICRASGPLIDWMNEELKISMSVVTEFKYPGHSVERMHAPPTRSGLELVKSLKKAVDQIDNIYLMKKSEVLQLITDDDRAVIGVEVDTPDGRQKIKAEKVILATNGFGANKDLVKRYIPEISNAQYFGYEANTGDAIRMTEELGAALSNMSAYQGHSAVSDGQGLLVTWGTIMMGGFMVNEQGNRFGNEAEGYSEFAVQVLNQPMQAGYIIFDEKIYQALLSIEDFKNLADMDAFKKEETIEMLADALKISGTSLTDELRDFNQSNGMKDRFGRENTAAQLEAPFYGIKVSPALFHTQGGVLINSSAQVLNKAGEVIQNLYAGGGAAVGVSGKHAYGYMSGNGLLAATGLGMIAGDHARESITAERVGANE
ncbi:FAD-dependent oxidoreductase [Bhargavaea ginsengi]|uniref:FAD-dependent oxidoreductase n=1 Tax=Bhargavaea ginsengi TaxID=426757 RepID=UPI003C71BAE4